MWTIGQIRLVSTKNRTGTDVMIFKIFMSKKIAKNWRFWLKTKLNYAKF
jgi:hypothetical protein